MAESQFAREYRAKMFGNVVSQFEKTDPEFSDFFKTFAYDEVINAPVADGLEPIDDKTRFLAILATLLGCGGIDEFHIILPAALNMGVSPIEAKEVVYQATAYLGIGRVLPFLKVTNAIFDMRGIELPLKGQGTTTPENRVEKGNQVQIDYFGESMREFWKNAPQGRRNINYWLAGNCFGDYYTRGGLNDQQREMITFCFIAAQGGCEPQLVAHALGNMKVGTGKERLYQIVEQIVPYIGYPRSLNAMSAIDQASAQLNK